MFDSPLKLCVGKSTDFEYGTPGECRIGMAEEKNPEPLEAGMDAQLDIRTMKQQQHATSQFSFDSTSPPFVKLDMFGGMLKTLVGFFRQS